MTDQEPEINPDEIERLHMFEWSGETISFEDALFERAHKYAAKTIIDRALPDVRDGLLPVVRRFLFAMHELGLGRANVKPKKSAKIVGDTMGAYHPHGDKSIYDSLVRFAQDWQMSLPLVKGQGNFGSIDNDPAAAMRYTEAKLSEAGRTIVQDLNEHIIAYAPNYDGSTVEPTVLPMAFPNLLVNGMSVGIAYILTCAFPPHNLAEAIDAALLVADDPNVSLKRVMRKMPAPDFPGGGIIINPENLESIYETGRGTIIQQAQFHIEQVTASQQAVIVTEMPYQIGSGILAQAITKAWQEGKITEMSTLPEDQTDKTGMRVAVKCKRGGSIETLTAQLLKLPQMRKTITFNFTAIVDGYPKTLSLIELLRHFINFRHEVVTKRLERELVERHARLLKVLAYIAASDVIDKVIKTIRGAENTETARKELVKFLRYTPHGKKKSVPISEDQAQAILDLRLSRLTKLNQFELREEAKQLATRIDEINAILKSKTGVMDIVKDELRQTKKQFAAPRQTVIHEGGAVQMVNGRREIAIVSAEAEDVTVYVARSGNALVQPVKGRRAGSGIPLQLRGSDELAGVVNTSTDKPVMLVSDTGTAYRVQLADVPLSSRSSTGQSLIALPKGDSMAGIFVENERDTHLLMITQHGQLKRIKIDEVLGNAHAGGVPAYGVPAGDRIVSVLPHADGDEVLIATAQGQVLRLDTSKNMRPVKTGSAGGVAGMKLKDGDEVVSACVVDPAAESLLTVHETGMGKRVKLDDYPVKGRATGGVHSSATDKPAKNPAGNIVMIACVPKKGDVQAITRRGSIVPLDYKRTPIVARAVIAKPAFDLGPGDAPFTVQVS